MWGLVRQLWVAVATNLVLRRRDDGMRATRLHVPCYALSGSIGALDVGWRRLHVANSTLLITW